MTSPLINTDARRLKLIIFSKEAYEYLVWLRIPAHEAFEKYLKSGYWKIWK